MKANQASRGRSRATTTSQVLGRVARAVFPGLRRHGQRVGFRADDSAVSTVVGGILIAGIVFTLLATIQFRFVPIWVADAEADHVANVREQLTALKGEIDRQAGNRTEIPVTHGIRITRPSTGVFDLSPPSSRLALESTATFSSFASSLGTPVSQTDFNVDASSIVFVERNGTMVADGDEAAWTEITGDILRNVSSVLSFRIRIDEVNEDHDGDYMEIEARNQATNAVEGRLRAYVTAHKSGYDVSVRVTDASGNFLYNQGEAYFSEDPKSPFWIDTLSAEYRWGLLIQQMTKPIEFRLIEHGLTGDYLFSYTEFVEGASEDVVTTAAGAAQSPYSGTFTGGGRLIYQTQTQQIPHQTFAYENGGIILEQADGAVMKVAPHFDPRMVSNFTKLDLVMPSVQADDFSAQGHKAITLKSKVTTTQDFFAIAPQFGMNITTAYPTVWTQFWTERFEAAGLSSGEFTVASGDNWATFSLIGKSSSTAYNDLNIRFSYAQVQVEAQI